MDREAEGRMPLRRLSIPYGQGTLPLVVDAARLVAVLEPEAPEATQADEGALVQDALQNPFDSSRLSALAEGKRRVLIITSDHTRPVPSAITLPLLLAEIRRGSPDADIRILIATGMHRPMTGAEMRAKFGDAIVDREDLRNHIATETGAMVDKGTLPSGGRLLLNGLVDWADLVVSEGFIEPHFFAGFSGGRKSVLPGIASAGTVMYNHNARFIASPHAVQGSLAKNPIHADMVYAARQAKLSFILNVLLDAQKRIIAAFAGDPEAAHEAGCAHCTALCSVRRVTADIVLTSNGGYPLDQNVYQAVKGMTAAEACVRPQGVVILCAALGDGHGGQHFFDWFAQAKDPAAITAAIEGIAPEDTQPDQWQAQILARVMGKATVIFVTGPENRALIKDMHMRWSPDIAGALAQAEALLGPDATLAVIPDGVGVIVA